LSERGDARHHQARVNTAQILPAQVPALQGAGAKVLCDHVDEGHEPTDDLLAFRVMQIKRHDPLIAVIHCPPVAHILLRWPHAADIVAATGHLDLDDLSPELGHQGATEWTSHDLCQL
jgi:hypothetical protein